MRQAVSSRKREWKTARYWQRVAVMLAGVVFIGVGVGLLPLSAMGNDPSDAHVMAIAAKIGVSFAALRIIVNTLWAIPELLFGRKYFGIGTFANWFLVGHIATFFHEQVFAQLPMPESFWARFLVMMAAVLLLSLGIAMYQTPDVGVAPYDALAILLRDYTPLPFFWCRIIVDGICAVLTFVFGGIVGLGTLACAFGLGPFISLFSKMIVARLCGMQPNKATNGKSDRQDCECITTKEKVK